jgi:hypothetical protein
MSINFENSKDLDEMRKMKREAREAILAKVIHHHISAFHQFDLVFYWYTFSLVYFSFVLGRKRL